MAAADSAPGWTSTTASGGGNNVASLTMPLPPPCTSLTADVPALCEQALPAVVQVLYGMIGQSHALRCELECRLGRITFDETTGQQQFHTGVDGAFFDGLLCQLEESPAWNSVTPWTQQVDRFYMLPVGLPVRTTTECAVKPLPPCQRAVIAIPVVHGPNSGAGTQGATCLVSPPPPASATPETVEACPCAAHAAAGVCDVGGYGLAHGVPHGPVPAFVVTHIMKTEIASVDLRWTPTPQELWVPGAGAHPLDAVSKLVDRGLALSNQLAASTAVPTSLAPAAPLLLAPVSGSVNHARPLFVPGQGADVWATEDAVEAVRRNGYVAGTPIPVPSTRGYDIRVSVKREEPVLESELQHREDDSMCVRIKHRRSFRHMPPGTDKVLWAVDMTLVWQAATYTEALEAMRRGDPPRREVEIECVEPLQYLHATGGDMVRLAASLLVKTANLFEWCAFLSPAPVLTVAVAPPPPPSTLASTPLTEDTTVACKS